jgi:hypothetical protein
MAAVERAYMISTRAFGVLMVVLGLLIVVTTLAGGGSPLSYRVVLGVAFALLGAGRLYLARAQ